MAGNKLRAAIKKTFSAIIDLARSESADLLLLSGDLFDSNDISQNQLDFFISEVKRLERTKVALLPGTKDHYKTGGFWEQWNALNPAANLLLMTNIESPYIEIPSISTTLYGIPCMAETSPRNPLKNLKRTGKNRYHVAMVYGNLIDDKNPGGNIYPFTPDDLIAGGFDYYALGGQLTMRDCSSIGIPAAYSGSPEAISPELEGAGNVLIVKLERENVTIEPKKVGNISWKEIEIQMNDVASIDDLKSKINKLNGDGVLLKVTLKGLVLLDANFNIKELTNELSDNFLKLEIIDKMSVLPDDVVEVKLHEKTIMGQYLKIMVEKMKTAKGPARTNLEESLKVGYSLLSGKEIW